MKCPISVILAVDCTWKAWGDWSPCPSECPGPPEYVSYIKRYRGMNQHKCGGKPCDQALQEEKEPCYIVPIMEKENSELKLQIISDPYS